MVCERRDYYQRYRNRCVHGDYRQRYQQRSVRSHNSIMIDHIEPCELSIRRPFRLGGNRQVEGNVYLLPSKNSAIYELEMTGYYRLPESILLRRTFCVNFDIDFLKVIDNVEGEGKHTIERSFILAGIFGINVHENRVSCSSDRGNLEIIYNCSNVPEIWAEESLLSDSYGNFQKGFAIRSLEVVNLPYQAETLIHFRGKEDL